MKYFFLFLVCLLSASCSSKPAPSLTYICVNPAMAIQGVVVESSDPNVKIGRDALRFTTESGAKVTLPLSLCMTVERAAE